MARYEPHVSTTSFEMRVVQPQSPALDRATKMMGPSVLEGYETPLVEREEGEESTSGYRRRGPDEESLEYAHAALVWWRFWGIIWALLVSAVAVIAVVFALLAWTEIQKYQHSNGNNIHRLNQCCADGKSNITNIYSTIGVIEGDIILIEGDITTIYNELTNIQNQTAVLFNETAQLEECCLNNTLAIQTLNTELFDLGERVGFTEADIDVLQQQTGDLQLQIDNL